MEQRVTDFFEMLRTRKVGLVGFGVTNNGIARMLAAKGIHVTIHDRQDRKELGEICQEMEEAGVSLSLGYNYLRTLEEDVIFRAPGVPFDLPELTAARKAGKVITSDLEMFFDLCPCPIIGVTGSDGKTTTTTLIAEMLRITPWWNCPASNSSPCAAARISPWSPTSPPTTWISTAP